MKNILTLFLNQENYVECNGLQNPITLEYINDATATVTITDRSDIVLSGPHVMDYIPNSDGRYIGRVPTLVSAFDGQRVVVVVEATAGSGYGYYGKWLEPAIYDTRRATDTNCC